MNKRRLSYLCRPSCDFKWYTICEVGPRSAAMECAADRWHEGADYSMTVEVARHGVKSVWYRVDVGHGPSRAQRI